MNWQLPNQLTVSRLAASVVFFTVLALVELGTPAATWLLMSGFVIYILAGITDVLDGYFARKWNIASAFGRIADPIVDKVIVCGGFVLLAGANFSFAAAGMPGAPGELEASLPTWLTGGMATGVQPWMVVVLLAREFVISAIRGYSESQGLKFPATPAGKIKMAVQSVALCTILFQLAMVPSATWAVALKLAMVWLTVIVTVLSALVYVHRARSLFRSDAQPE